MITLLLRPAATAASPQERCGGDGNQDTADRASAGFPMTVENRGQRVLLIGDNAVLLLPTSALDKVVGLVGNPLLEIYDDELRQRVAGNPRIGREQTARSVEVTLEEVIAQTQPNRTFCRP